LAVTDLPSSASRTDTSACAREDRIENRFDWAIAGRLMGLLFAAPPRRQQVVHPYIPVLGTPAPGFRPKSADGAIDGDALLGNAPRAMADLFENQNPALCVKIGQHPKLTP
jgi:hypothetical protein